MDMDLLQQAVTATKGGEIPVAPKASLADMQRDGLIEIGPQEKPGSNKFQFRATPSGVQAFEASGSTGDGATGTNAEQPASGGDNATTAATSDFKIDDDIPPPSKSGRTGPKAKYPFDALNVGQSFFVAATDKRPEPWKSLQSTISTAQRRHAVEDGTKTNKKGETVPNYKPTRKFRMEKRNENGKDGARIWRVA